MRATLLPPGPKAYAQAVALLRANALVALPTETVYGLAGHAKSDIAIDAIYLAKGRPAHNPLITHVLDPGAAGDFAHVSPLAMTLIGAFWPGPLTLVLPRKHSDLSARASAGLATIALRCPDAPWRAGFLNAGWSDPLVMPSANLSGHVSPTEAKHVAQDLGDRIDLIIDGGPCRAGLESTVLAISEDHAVLLRDGAIARETLEAITGPLVAAKADQPIASPGMLLRHYAPQARLRLNATSAEDGEILIGFGPDFGTPNLSHTGRLEEAASRLYGLLRDLDGPDVQLAVAPVPETGLGLAINDRLRRAALGR